MTALYLESIFLIMYVLKHTFSHYVFIKTYLKSYQLLFQPPPMWLFTNITQINLSLPWKVKYKSFVVMLFLRTVIKCYACIYFHLVQNLACGIEEYFKYAEVVYPNQCVFQLCIYILRNKNEWNLISAGCKVCYKL